MNLTEVLIQILELAVSVWKTKATGGAADTAELSAKLLEIARKANQAYTLQEGKPIDPSLLQPIEPV